MGLVFERGSREAPVGHALMYFRADDGAILATYLSVPPIKFDLTSYVPGFLAGAMQGLDLGDAMVATPMPPIPEEVAGVEYLHALAKQRHDDLVYGGAVPRDPMQLAAYAAESAREYGDLYQAPAMPEAEAAAEIPRQDPEVDRYAGLSEQEQLREMTALTGGLRDSLSGTGADPGIERRMRILAGLLPVKYRAFDLVDAALVPGEKGQKLAQLYLERAYKLYNEDYLDLERIDREIDAVSG